MIQLIRDRVLKEEFQHTAYATNAYVTLGLLWKQVSHGKRIVKLEISTKVKTKTGNMKSSKRSLTSSGLELKLDELRKELSSTHGGIFPHSVLSTQQISILSAQKPTSILELETMIGKLKTEKYGSKILEEIAKYTETEQPENVPPDDSTLGEGQGSEKKPTKRLKTDEAQGSEKRPTKRLKTDEGQGSENRAPKRLKSNKAVVLIESSGDET